MLYRGGDFPRSGALYWVKSRYRKVCMFEIVTVCYEPVTGAHVGTLALFFPGDAALRKK